MDNIQITSLPVQGYGRRPVANRFLKQTRVGSVLSLAIIFPGLQYTCEMPLLYYLTSILINQGTDVLQLYTDYNQASYRTLPQEEQLRWLREDALAALRLGVKQRDYTRLILVGKSIGTMALAQVLGSGVTEEVRTIWLTPLLRQPAVAEAAARLKAPALFIVGTGDATYDAPALAAVRETSAAEALLVEGANHSLEIPGDPLRSLHILQQVMGRVADFSERVLTG